MREANPILAARLVMQIFDRTRNDEHGRKIALREGFPNFERIAKTYNAERIWRQAIENCRSYEITLAKLREKVQA